MPVEPLAKPIVASPPPFASTTAFFQSAKPVPTGARSSWPAQSSSMSIAQAEVAPAAAAVEIGEAVAQRLGGRVLHHRVHRACGPTGRRHRGCSGRPWLLAELLDQLAADFLHEVAALLAELLVAAVADGAERRRRRGLPLLLGDVAVAVHLAQHIVAAVERLLRRADRIVVGRRLGQNREIGGFRQRQFVDVLVEIGARGGLDAVGVAAEEDRVEVELEDLLLASASIRGGRRGSPRAPCGRYCSSKSFSRYLATCWVMVDPPLARPPPVTLFAVIIDTAPIRPGEVDPVMLEEGLVLGRDEGVDHQRRIFVVGQLDPPFAGEGLHRHAVIAADVGRQRRLVGEQLLATTAARSRNRSRSRRTARTARRTAQVEPAHPAALPPRIDPLVHPPLKATRSGSGQLGTVRRSNFIRECV